MANENERKHDPAENRQNRMGGGPDDAKIGGDEKNVGLTNDVGGGAARGMGVGTTGVIGGSADFLTDTDASAQSETTTGQQSQQNEMGQQQSGQGGALFGSAENTTRQSDQIGGDSSFGGQSGSGTSAMGGNSGQSDLGSAGIGSGGGQSSSGEATSGSGGSAGADDSDADIGPGGQSEIGGASDLGGGETGLGSAGSDFARDGQGAVEEDEAGNGSGGGSA